MFFISVTKSAASIKACGRPAAGCDNFDSFMRRRKKIDDFLHRQKTAGQGNIEFIQNNDIIISRPDDTLRLIPAAMGQV